MAQAVPSQPAATSVGEPNVSVELMGEKRLASLGDSRPDGPWPVPRRRQTERAPPPLPRSELSFYSAFRLRRTHSRWRPAGSTCRGTAYRTNIFLRDSRIAWLDECIGRFLPSFAKTSLTYCAYRQQPLLGFVYSPFFGRSKRTEKGPQTIPEGAGSPALLTRRWLSRRTIVSEDRPGGNSTRDSLLQELLTTRWVAACY